MIAGMAHRTRLVRHVSAISSGAIVGAPKVRKHDHPMTTPPSAPAAISTERRSVVIPTTKSAIATAITPPKNASAEVPCHTAYGARARNGKLRLRASGPAIRHTLNPTAAIPAATPKND